MRSIRQRHENTKEKLNQLVSNHQKGSDKNVRNRDISNSDATRSVELKTNENKTQLNLSSVHQSPHLLPSKLRDKSNESGKPRGSFSYSNSFPNLNRLEVKNNEDELLNPKRNSQIYHSLFKSPEKMIIAKHEKRSRKSQRSHRLENPFIPLSEKLIPSTPSEKLSVTDFQIVLHLSENKIYSTEKAVNLNGGDPLIIKIFKVCKY